MTDIIWSTNKNSLNAIFLMRCVLLQETLNVHTDLDTIEIIKYEIIQNIIIRGSLSVYFTIEFSKKNVRTGLNEINNIT